MGKVSAGRNTYADYDVGDMRNPSRKIMFKQKSPSRNRRLMPVDYARFAVLSGAGHDVDHEADPDAAIERAAMEGAAMEGTDSCSA